jgi:hypothetical protein
MLALFSIFGPILFLQAIFSNGLETGRPMRVDAVLRRASELCGAGRGIRAAKSASETLTAKAASPLFGQFDTGSTTAEVPGLYDYTVLTNLADGLETNDTNSTASAVSFNAPRVNVSGNFSTAEVHKRVPHNHISDWLSLFSQTNPTPWPENREWIIRERSVMA